MLAVHKPGTGKRITLAVVVALALFIVSNFIDEYRIFQGAQVAAYLVGIVSIVLLTGYSGQITLGQGAFMAVGAYSAALVVQEFGLPIWLSFFVAVIAAALFGAIIGISAGRLTGPYLAGATLAFAVVVNVPVVVIGLPEKLSPVVPPEAATEDTVPPAPAELHDVVEPSVVNTFPALPV